MVILFCKISRLACCLIASILAHLLFMYAVRILGSCDYAAPVNMTRGVVVELADASVNPEVPSNSPRVRVEKSGAGLKNQFAAREGTNSHLAVRPEKFLSESKAMRMPAVVAEGGDLSITSGKATNENSSKVTGAATISSPVYSPLKSSMFLSSNYEKLTYMLSMFGAPVGNAQLEATAGDGQVAISLRIQSNELFSTIYPVDNLVETRHVDGRYIMTKIRQREGSFRHDALFTINLLKKRVSWIEPLNGSSRQLTVPDDDLLDTLSGIYYLRNHSLSVGQNETLHIFDNEIYAAVPVEILRSEEIWLPNLSKVDTLVVRPVQKAAGMFRHSGDVLIWLTNDVFKVPVKIVTTIPLGTVTAELVAAETQ